ncbi:MAG TPA: STAS domain-containing protein [Aurantimonas sp.]|uniref:STAS domain-containing protein n=1 Tax=Aurantimonas marianensis TaxID=2920428 RepID=A0A9X2KDD9_9HYPH|nr:STAS domain-containing protein [Aurantimonas marianensis]MCP3053529.1 STAS domain-containing protein [Aurantimonas marianensis]
MAKKATRAVAAVELAGILDLKAAGPLFDQLLTLRGKPVTVDAAGVEKVGAQCIQILHSAAATWHADEVAFTIVEPSETFRSGLDLLGLSETFSQKDIAA